MSSRYGTQLAQVAASTVKAQNTDLLAADFQQKRGDSKIRITIAITSAVIVALTGSDGSSVLLNNGTALVANGIHTEELALDITRTWNIQTANVAGLTCTLLSLVEVDA